MSKAFLITGTPGSGKTTLVQFAYSTSDARFIDADEVVGLCEWREFETDKAMGLVTDFVETGKDDWYEKYGWYWRRDYLEQFLKDNPDVIICGSSENVVECYDLFDEIVVIKVREDELLSNLASPERNNPFGKTTKQRSGFMKWQEHLIKGADNHTLHLVEGNQTENTYIKIIEIVGSI